MPLAGTWVNFSAAYPTAEYRLLNNGLVVCKGLIKSGGTGTLATLPVGYRPSETHVFMTVSFGNNPTRVDISAAGVLTAIAPYSSALLDLTPFTWYAEQ